VKISINICLQVKNGGRGGIRPLPEQVNFVSEVKIPILMVSKYILVMQGRLGGGGA
jgi:hypothetical protein